MNIPDIPEIKLPDDETERCVYMGQKRRTWITPGTKLNDMSYWHPHVVKSSPIPSPKTQIIHLSDEWLGWLGSDSYSDERKAMFQEYILEQLDPYFIDKELFVRVGTFSDKFMFDRGPHLKDIESLGQHILDVFYSCMLCVAGTTDTVVIREYIKPQENTPTIYQGMPLRREVRYFVDFDKNEVLGYSEYWHPKEMAQMPFLNLTGSLQEQLESISDEAVETLTNTRQNLKTPHILNPIDDWLTYAAWYRKQEPLENYALALLGDIEEFARVCELKGRWSVDVMFNSKEEPYLIDMALMRHSALKEYMVKVKKE